MFGLYRLLLALMVVGQHLGGLGGLGCYAVFAFFVLSGYLMTLVTSTQYGFGVSSFVKFSVARVLRLFPVYWVCLIAAIAVIMFVGGDVVAAYHHHMMMPDGMNEWLRNLLMVFPDRTGPLMIPPAWALTIELFFYALIGLGVFRARGIAWSGVLVGSAYHAILLVQGVDWSLRYLTFPAALMPFSAGAVLFHEKQRLMRYLENLPTWLRSVLPELAFGCMLATWYVGNEQGATMMGWFYLNLVLSIVLIVGLLGRKWEGEALNSIDRWLGDLSYPIYLSHYLVGLIVIEVADLIGYQLVRPNLTLLVVSLPFVLLIGLLLAALIERPMERVRHRWKRYEFGGLMTGLNSPESRVRAKDS